MASPNVFSRKSLFTVTQLVSALAGIGLAKEFGFGGLIPLVAAALVFGAVVGLVISKLEANPRAQITVSCVLLLVCLCIAIIFQNKPPAAPAELASTPAPPVLAAPPPPEATKNQQLISIFGTGANKCEQLNLAFAAVAPDRGWNNGTDTYVSESSAYVEWVSGYLAAAQWYSKKPVAVNRPTAATLVQIYCQAHPEDYVVNAAKRASEVLGAPRSP